MGRGVMITLRSSYRAETLYAEVYGLRPPA
jgi:hypothetical protein